MADVIDLHLVVANILLVHKAIADVHQVGHVISSLSAPVK